VFTILSFQVPIQNQQYHRSKGENVKKCKFGIFVPKPAMTGASVGNIDIFAITVEWFL